MKLAALFVLTLLAGCSPLNTAIQNNTPLNLTADQITALDKAGQAVVGCLQFGGPPANGNLNLMILPKTATGNIAFGPDCHPNASVGLSQ